MEEEPEEVPDQEDERAEEPEWMVETALPEATIEDRTVAEAMTDSVVESEVQEEVAQVEAEVEPEPVATTEETEDRPEAEPEPAPVVAEEKESEDKFQPVLENAQNALAKGEIEQALQSYNRLITRRRKLDTVIEDLQQALYDYPVDTHIWETLGDSYVKSDKLQEALDAYTKAEELLR
jgi:tetratricopeptide (TPR) repeat protein